MAITLNLFRDGAVGFIDWLGLIGWHFEFFPAPFLFVRWNKAGFLDLLIDRLLQRIVQTCAFFAYAVEILQFRLNRDAE